MAMTNITGKVSFHSGKTLSIAHNLGKERNSEKWNKDGHISAERTPLNVVLTNTPLKDFFEETFGEAIEKYNIANEKKHPDRVTSVKEYYNKQKNKAQESIFQLSDHENYIKLVDEVGEKKADEIHKQYLTDVYNQFKKENPSLKIFSATIHLDETKYGTPHLHLDYLPVAESNRGLTTKVSMDGAMKQLGFIRERKQKYSETPYKQWLNAQRLRAEQIASKYINVIPSEPSVIGHQQQNEWRAKEQKRNAVQKLTGAFTANRTKDNAQAVIDNAESIKQVARQEAKEITDKAKVEQLKAKKFMEIADNKISIANQAIAEAQRNIAIAEKNNKVVNTKIGKLAVTIEQEVQKRIAPKNLFLRQQQEDERYKNRNYEQQQAVQELLQKVKNKSTQKGR